MRYAALLLALATGLSGCSKPVTQRFDVPVERAFAVLVASDITSSICGREYMSIQRPRVRTETVPNQSITWRISDDQRERGLFIAKLKPVKPAATEIVLDYQWIDENGSVHAGDGGTRSEQIAVFAEKVASRLEGRGFDNARVTRQIASGSPEMPDKVDLTNIQGASERTVGDMRARDAAERARAAGC